MEGPLGPKPEPLLHSPVLPSSTPELGLLSSCTPPPTQDRHSHRLAQAHTVTGTRSSRKTLHSWSLPERLSQSGLGMRNHLVATSSAQQGREAWRHWEWGWGDSQTGQGLGFCRESWGAGCAAVAHLKIHALSLPHCGSSSPPPRTWERHAHTHTESYTLTHTHTHTHTESYTCSVPQMQQSRETEAELA